MRSATIHAPVASSSLNLNLLTGSLPFDDLLASDGGGGGGLWL